MAIIGTIRKHSALAVIIVGVAIAAFVIGDLGKRRTQGTTEIGSINGEDIPYLEFNAKVEENITAQQENQGDEKITEEMAYTIRQNTWNNMVREILLGDEYDKLGLAVSTEELYELVQGRYPHRFILQYFKDPNTGMYNPEMVRNYIRNLDKMEAKARDQWLMFEKAIRQDREELKLNILISKAYYIPRSLLRKNHENQTSTVKLRYVFPNIYTIPDSAVRLTDADFNAFYEKNKSFFYSEEPLVDLEYVLFEVQPSEEDRKNTKDEVTRFYSEFTRVSEPQAYANANSDQKFDTGFIRKGVLPAVLDSLLFTVSPGTFIPPFQDRESWFMAKLIGTQERPDSMQGAHLMVTWAETGLSKNVIRSKEQAKLRADTLMAAIRMYPDKFADITKMQSDYPTAKQDGGELKWFTDDNPNFALFFNEGMNMKPGEVKIIETPIGYSLFKLTEKTEPMKKLKVAILQRDIEPSTRTFQDTYTQASSFAGSARTPEAFDSESVSRGLNKRMAQSVREMDNNVMGLENVRQMVRWAFAETTKTGEVSPVFDMTGRYVVAVVRTKYPEGYQTVENLKTRIEPTVKNFKKSEIMASRVDEAIKSSQEMGTVATRLTARIDTAMVTFSGMGRSSLARDYEALGKVFTLPAGVISGPVKGVVGVYAVMVDEIVPAPPKEDFTYERMEAIRDFYNRVPNEMYDALLKNAEIVDNRVWFY